MAFRATRSPLRARTPDPEHSIVGGVFSPRHRSPRSEFSPNPESKEFQYIRTSTMARESGTQSSTQTIGRSLTLKPGQSTDKGKTTEVPETQYDDNKPIGTPDESPGGDPDPLGGGRGRRRSRSPRRLPPPK